MQLYFCIQFLIKSLVWHFALICADTYHEKYYLSL